MDRKQKIDYILGRGFPGIPIHLWLEQIYDPYNEAWRAACLEAVNWHHRTTSRKDLDSGFAKHLKNKYY